MNLLITNFTGIILKMFVKFFQKIVKPITKKKRFIFSKFFRQRIASFLKAAGIQTIREHVWCKRVRSLERRPHVIPKLS